MTHIPQPPDPTLDAADRALEDAEKRVDKPPCIGMSQIGETCHRKIWYSFRWCSPIRQSAESIKRTQDGDHGEDVQAKRLQLVPGVELMTRDPRTARQFHYSDLGGHFQGAMDGGIKGLLQAPQTWHVWEHKQAGEERVRTSQSEQQQQLQAAKEKHGEKNALKEWNGAYYGQAVLMMHYAGMDRHYLTCANSGNRHVISCRTDANPGAAHSLIEKAKRIIESPVPLPMIAEDPDWYDCQKCQHKEVCKENKAPDVSCRTCTHSTPTLAGDREWICEKYENAIPADFQAKGCDGHLYLPDLLPFAKATGASAENFTIDYIVNETGNAFSNGPGENHYTSHEIAACDYRLLGQDHIDTTKKPSVG
jgi:hypothetical protein